MLFNSYEYALFLPIVFIIYWLLPNKWRWVLLLTSSYFFYMCWKPSYIVLIIMVTLLSFFSGLIIEKTEKIGSKKAIMIIAIGACLGVLFVFKYFNFFFETVSTFISFFDISVPHVVSNLILPVGISFYTFQAIGYVVDVYRRSIPAEHHLGYYATYISFFPQLVAGPIERAKNLLPQLQSKKEFNYELASYGLKQMAWGYFKKVVIADTLTVYVGSIFDAPRNYVGMPLLLAMIGFSLEIYCDFSGYSDIAIGTAKLLGIKLSDNFKMPYFSVSIKDFWRRWHITLSEWMRDYIYIPLGGNRKGKLRRSINLMITFLVSGLWHGANWNYVVWGGIHGVAQVIESCIPKKKRRTIFPRIVNVILVFLIVSFAWVFFASNSLSDAIYIISNMFSGITNPIGYIQEGMQTNLSWESIRCLLISVIILAVFDYLSLKVDVINQISKMKAGIRWGIYTLFLVWMLMNIQIADNSQFIYFQF